MPRRPKTRHRVRLVPGEAARTEEGAARLRAAGYQVDGAPMDAAAFSAMRKDPPAAAVIDLDRAPAHGRDIALAIRKAPATRRVVLVFVGGAPEKVARVRRLLPDAAFTTWGRLPGALKGALARPPEDPVVPPSVLEGYSGTPLPGKLGIKAGMAVALVGAPEGFEETLGALPEAVTLRGQARGRCDLVIWFTRSRRELDRRIERLGSIAGRGGLWIAWPKKASGVSSDLSQTVVRRMGLDAGLVDYKVCAIDATWAALRFTRRRAG